MVKEHDQFIRKAKLLVGNASTAIDLSELQFNFSVKMADISNPQFATVRIFNVSKDTQNQIKALEYDRLRLEAGYQHGAYGVIFDGKVIQGRRGRESPVDTYIDLLCAVGYEANQAGIGTTLAAGSTTTDAAQAAANAMGVPLSDHTAGATTSLPRGQVLYGMARDVMGAAANGLDASWFHAADGVQMVDGKTFAPGAPLVLNSATGMIGWPEQTQEGIRVRCLLNPKVSVATRIKLDNASIQQAEIAASVKYINLLPSLDADGMYRVLYFEHNGDTRRTNWYTDIIGISVNDTTDGGISSLYQRGLI